MLELVIQDRERGLKSLMDVRVQKPSAIGVGVGLDRLDQRLHARGRIAKLADDPLCVQPGDGHLQCLGRGRSGDGVALLQPRLVDPSDSQRLGELPCVRYAQLFQPSEHLLLGVGGLERRKRTALGRPA